MGRGSRQKGFGRGVGMRLHDSFLPITKYLTRYMLATWYVNYNSPFLTYFAKHSVKN